VHEDDILGMLDINNKPLSITEIRDMLSRKLGRSVPYETARRDLLTLAANGLIGCKSIGKGKRVTWVFWSGGTPSTETRSRANAHDPFSVSVARRDRMNPQEQAALYDAVVDRCQELIQAKLQSSRYLVLCDGRIVKTADLEPTDEEVKHLEQRLGKVCYVLTQDRIEESRWGPIRDGDYYPTIDVFLADKEWSDDEVFQRGVHLVSDFDTGNPDVAAFNKDHVDLVEVRQVPLVRRAFHLGKHYDYLTASLKIGIKDVAGNVRCIQKTCRAVFPWVNSNKNPFLLANPKREAFLGRDVMLSFPFGIHLSGRHRRSTVTLE